MTTVNLRMNSLDDSIYLYSMVVSPCVRRVTQTKRIGPNTTKK